MQKYKTRVNHELIDSLIPNVCSAQNDTQKHSLINMKLISFYIRLLRKINRQ